MDTIARCRLKSFVLRAVVGGLIAAASAGLVVAMTDDLPTMIQACANKSIGAVRVVETAADCKSSEIPISWNTHGESGGQGPAGPTGPTGPTGPAGPFPDPLQSGKTLRGTWAIDFAAANGGDPGISPISFGFTLSGAPVANLVHPGDVATESCPGSAGDPQAAPGNLCVYEASQFNVGFSCVASVGGSFACGVADKYGASLFVTAAGPGSTLNVGSWAVTAQ